MTEPAGIEPPTQPAAQKRPEMTYSREYAIFGRYRKDLVAKVHDEAAAEEWFRMMRIPRSELDANYVVCWRRVGDWYPRGGQW